MVFKKLSILLFFLLWGADLGAQDFQRKTTKLLNKSKEALYSRDWDNAVLFMDRAVENESDNYRIHLEQASLLYGINDIKKVVPALEQAFELSEKWPAKFTDFYFLLGKESFDAGKYQQARKPLEIYKQKGYNEESIKLADVILLSIDFAIAELEEKQNLSMLIQNLAADQIFRSIYFPFFTLYPEEFLFFTGQRKGSVEEGIYRAKLDGHQFTNIEEVPVINSNENEGAAAISADGRVMVFTSCNRRDGFGSCDLYVSYFEGTQWTKPANLGNNINTKAWESQPFLSSDGRFLLFSSNRSGGFGKRDLYRSVFVDGQWTPAENLGSEVNTFADEISPFLNLANDQFYFSSNGRIGMGGFDIYKVAWPIKGSSKIINIGYPINTYSNELSYHQKLDGAIYWSRELPSDEKYPPSNIFYFESNETVNSQVNLVFGKVTDAESQKPIEANIQVYDLKKDSLVHETKSNSLSGAYRIVVPYNSEFSFYVSANNYLYQSRQLQLNSDREELNFSLENIKTGKTIELNNIYFGFDSAELNEKSKNEIIKLHNFLTQNPTYSIEIAGYTDQKGSDGYNLQLSKRRAEAVYHELLKKKIKKERLKAVGYGANALPSGEFRKAVVIRLL